MIEPRIEVKIGSYGWAANGEHNHLLQLILNTWQERDAVSLVWRHLSISLYAVVLIEKVGKIHSRLANTGRKFAVLLFAYLPPKYTSRQTARSFHLDCLRSERTKESSLEDKEGGMLCLSHDGNHLLK